MVRWLESEIHSNCSDLCVICSMKKVLYTTKNSYNSIALRKFYFMVILLSKGKFIAKRQEDAHEFLLFLFNLIRTAIINRVGMENASRTSAMDQIFVGLIKSTITCACEAQSSILDPIGAITLDISSDAITTIIDAFDVYCCGSFAEYDCEESLRKEGLKNDPLPKRCKFNEIDLNDSNSEENCKGSHSQSPSPKRRKFNDIDLNDPNPEEN